MKMLIVLCAVFCVAYAVPTSAGMQQYHIPPKPFSLMAEKLAMMNAVDPVPPKPLTIQQNEVQEHDNNADSQSVSVPLGVKSTGSTPALSVVVENTRSDAIQWYWINYSGQPICYSIIQPGTAIHQLTYGNHPWLITDSKQQNIALFIPYAANTKITVDATASW